MKLPVVPLHTWLPDAHTEAPTAGSVDLAGLVLKVGAYGFLRMLVPLFPRQAMDFAPLAMGLGVAGILYAALVALRQTDLKRLIAYTSVSHMGFVILGIFAWNQLALLGAMMIMIAHGISTAALFVLVGDLDDRMHTRDIRRMGGLAATIPKMRRGVGLLRTGLHGAPAAGEFRRRIAGLPGRLPGPPHPGRTCGARGDPLGRLFLVRHPSRLFWSQHPRVAAGRHESREAVLMTSMIGVNLWLGIYPDPALRAMDPAVQALQRTTAELPPRTTVPLANVK